MAEERKTSYMWRKNISIRQTYDLLWLWLNIGFVWFHVDAEVKNLKSVFKLSIFLLLAPARVPTEWKSPSQMEVAPQQTQQL